MILMILILATLFYVMLIVSSFFLILIENENTKYFWSTTLLCLFGVFVSYLFLNNFYDRTFFTELEIITRYDYKFINVMQYIYFYMCIIMNVIYLIKGFIYLKKKKTLK